MKKFWSTWGTLYLWGMLFGHGLSDFSSDLQEITEKIVNEYFRMFKCVTYITDKLDNWNYLGRENQIFLVKISASEDEVLSEETLLVESYEQGCGGYVIQVNSNLRASMIRHLREAKKKAISYRYNKQRYLFLPTEEGDLDLEFLNQSIMYFFPNLLVLTFRKGSSGFSLISHTTFDFYKQHILKVSYEVLDTWSLENGFERKVDLYPNKIRNVRGKNLRFALIHYVPYTLVIRCGNKTTYDGLESRIAQIFVEIINGTWDAKDCKDELWGDFFPNGTSNGIVGSVQKHSADFGFAAVYQWNCEDVDCSFTYLQAGITCLVPKPQLVSGWYTVLIPFGVYTWVALIIAYFFISLFVLCITRAGNNIRGIKNSGFCSMAGESFFNVFRLQLEQIPRIAHKNTPVAVYIRISTLYYYFVAAFWQGIIASVLMAPQYEKPINTVLDMVQSFPRLKWGANHDVWLLAITGATDPVLRKIIDNYVILSNEELEKRPRQRDFAFFMERLPHGHYGFSDYINKQNIHYLRLMKSDIYRGNVVTVMPRDCPYIEYYDHIVSWMFDTGLVHKLENQVSLEMIDNSLQLMIKTSNENERYEGIVLALRHLEGPLYIYFLGILVSSAVFIIEKGYFPSKLKNKRTVRRKLFTLKKRKKVQN